MCSAFAPDMPGAKCSRVIADAVTHMLARLELGQPINYVVPSERTEQEEQ